MTQRMNVFWMVLLGGLIMSCGPGKKLRSAQEEANELRDRNNELTASTKTFQSEISKLMSQNDSLTNAFSSYKTQCESTQRTLEEVNNILDEEAETMETVEDKLEQALADFHNKGVDVYSKQGLVYVSLSDDLLYRSGSARLDKDGKKALASLASVLNSYPKLKVIVLGNTDNMPTKKGDDDNWSLSTERANGVVRILRDDYKVNPSRLTAAGKGKYNPVADNTTKEGRAKNRRTDIILNPDIDRVWDSARKDD